MRKITSWKPTMTEAEARAWNSDSKYKDFVYHRTWRRSVEGIKEQGFMLPKISRRGKYNVPRYFSFSSKPDNANVSYGNVLLTCAIRVHNPVPPSVFNPLQDKIFAKYRRLFAKQFGTTWKKLTHKQQMDFFDTQYFFDLGTERAKKLKKNYDSMVWHESDIWVFNKESITVVGQKDI